MVSFSAAFSSAVSPVVLADPRVGFFAVFLTAISRRHFLGDLALLEDPDRVAERVAEAHVGAVEMLDGLLREVTDAARLEGLVKTANVVGAEDEGAHRTFGDQLAELGGGGVIVQWRTGLLQVDLRTVAGDAHRQPAVRALLDVLALLKPELVDVEVECLVLVEDEDRCDVQLGDHLSFSLGGSVWVEATEPRARPLLQNCSITSRPSLRRVAAWPPSRCSLAP